jgi:succinate dehydrogenase hydrophobic anchor subunit
MNRRKQENTWIWFIKQASGGLVFLVILVHLVVNHLVAAGGLLTYSDVIRYFSHPWVVVMEIFFLIVVVGHSLLGLRSILLDFNPTAAFLRVTDFVFVILGSAAVLYGVWLALTIASVV